MGRRPCTDPPPACWNAEVDPTESSHGEKCGGEAAEPGVSVVGEFLALLFDLAHRRPQALQSVRGPIGPARHSGESVRPQLPQIRPSLLDADDEASLMLPETLRGGAAL